MGAATSHNMQLRFIVLVLLVLSTQAETSRRRPFSEAGRRLLWGYTDTRRRAVPTPAPTSATIYCDGANGDWVVKSYSNLNAVPGDNLIFKYGTSHDVYEMASEAAYNSCDFTGATEKGSTTAGGGNGLSVSLSGTGDKYYACSQGLRTEQSAWEVPVIMFLMKSLCPGASITVQWYFGVSNFQRAISMVIPLSLSAFSLSRTQAYLKDLLFISAASFSNFSITRLSIPPSL